MTDLTRYLFFSSRMVWPVMVARAASAIVPHFFGGGDFTGYPACIRPSYLFWRGVGVNHSGQQIQALEAAGVLRRVEFPDTRNAGGQRDRVYHLQPDDEWKWSPVVREQALLDWATVTRPERAWSGGWELVQELAPLFAGRRDVTVSPHDPRHAKWIAIARRLANRYGLDVLREGIAGALQDIEAIAPFEPHVFERHFSGLVLRSRRSENRRMERACSEPS